MTSIHRVPNSGKAILATAPFLCGSWFAKHETTRRTHSLSAAASFVSLSKHARSREKYLFKLKGSSDRQECANIELHVIICPNNKCGLLIAAPPGVLSCRGGRERNRRRASPWPGCFFATALSRWPTYSSCAHTHAEKAGGKYVPE